MTTVAGMLVPRVRVAHLGLVPKVCRPNGNPRVPHSSRTWLEWGEMNAASSAIRFILIAGRS